MLSGVVPQNLFNIVWCRVGVRCYCVPMTATHTTRRVTFVVPCSGPKLNTPARARDLYTGTLFRHQLHAAELEAAATTRDLGVEARVVILSALHGILELDDVVAPYDERMGTTGEVADDFLALTVHGTGLHTDDVYSLLPSAYHTKLARVMGWFGVTVTPVYESAPGVGFQRGTCSSLIRHSERIMAQ